MGGGRRYGPTHSQTIEWSFLGAPPSSSDSGGHTSANRVSEHENCRTTWA
jgi:hypothetical protein